jgi:transcriptional regulator of arginine metabolism
VSTADARRRREAVARILRTRRVSTQEDLLASLRREGFRSTQGTLSRDLARLGARRVSRPGGAYYEVGDTAPASAAAAVSGLVAALATNGSLVVIRTLPGSAPAVARAIDLARLDGVLGTLAGDDTVFVAPSRGNGARALAGRLAELFRPGPAGDGSSLYPPATRRHSARERSTQSSMASPSK